ncbi:hypothetical protein COU77_00220 [Candidatus Peregrinibacteria bacterium CG10_big_fil_rev_8_21_14_0_10_49_16]|nr:MAG: hypothetical protein COU77_00220 [Candidatus Peregrinibacteria bacterium CG10_big_fil_rev_8_21_14_0_10_49_16]
MSKTKPPLWKQVLGAGTGALVALGVYTAYTMFAPQLAERVGSVNIQESFSHLQAYFMHDFVGKTTLPDSPRPSRSFIRNLADEQNAVMPELSVRARQIARRYVDNQTTEDPSAQTQERIVVTFEPVEEKSAGENMHADLTDSSASTGEWEEPLGAPEEEQREAEVVHVVASGDSELPSSGVTVWLAVLGAVSIGVIVQRKRLKDMLSQGYVEHCLLSVRAKYDRFLNM